MELNLWKRFGITVSVFGIVFFNLNGCANKRDRDFRETMSWITQTYNPHDGGTNYGQGYGWQEGDDVNRNVTEKFHETISYDGCNFTIHIETLPVGVFKDTPSSRTITLNLGSLDPESLTIKKYASSAAAISCDLMPDADCDEAEIAFSTHNDVPIIDDQSVEIFENLTGKDHETKGDSKEHQVDFIVDNLDYSQRLARALKHAIELCGGQSSKF